MAAPVTVRTFSGPREPTHFSLPMQQDRSMKDSGRVLIHGAGGKRPVEWFARQCSPLRQFSVLTRDRVTRRGARDDKDAVANHHRAGLWSGYDSAVVRLRQCARGIATGAV